MTRRRSCIAPDRPSSPAGRTAAGIQMASSAWALVVVLASVAAVTPTRAAAQGGTQGLGRDHPDHPASVQVTGIHHTLPRQWAET